MIKKIILREDQLEDLISSLPDYEDEVSNDEDVPCRCNDFSLIYNVDCESGCADHGGMNMDSVAPITGMGQVEYSYPGEIASSNASSSFGYTPLSEQYKKYK